MGVCRLFLGAAARARGGVPPRVGAWGHQNQAVCGWGDLRADQGSKPGPVVPALSFFFFGVWLGNIADGEIYVQIKVRNLGFLTPFFALLFFFWAGGALGPP